MVRFLCNDPTISGSNPSSAVLSDRAQYLYHVALRLINTSQISMDNLVKHLQSTKSLKKNEISVKSSLCDLWAGRLCFASTYKLLCDIHISHI